MAAGRRGCVNSLWSGTERVRIGERLKATLAGILELDLLRCKHLEMVNAELVEKEESGTRGIDQQGATLKSDGSATCRRQQVPSPSEMVSPTQPTALASGGNSGDGRIHSRGSGGGGGNSRWSTLSWDAPSDLLSPPTPDLEGAAQLDCDSRPSSGFYSVSGSSLSDSCYSVSSEAAPGGPGGPGGAGPGRPVPPSGGVGASRLWEQRPLSADHSDTQWLEVSLQPQAQSSEETTEVANKRPVSTGDLELNGLMFLSDLCSSLGDHQPGSFLLLPDSSSSSSPTPRPPLDPRFCSDLVSRRTKEVYPYPSPLHAVALQSPLFTCCRDPSPPPRLSPTPDSTQPEEEPSPHTPDSPPPPPRPLPSPTPPSLTHLEQYITRLAHRYRCRLASNVTPSAAAATPGLGGHRHPRTPRHGSTQSLTAFETRSATSGHQGVCVTPCKSLLGNAGRVSLSSIGKKASRNSINLGHLPSVTGEDLSINLHLNLNLNLSPGLSGSLGEPKRSWEGAGSGSVGALRGDCVTPTASPSSTSLSTPVPTPAMRPRPRIATCPTSLNHRSSLEVAGSGPGSAFGSLAFSRSLDWSSVSPGPMSVSGLGSSPGLGPSLGSSPGLGFGPGLGPSLGSSHGLGPSLGSSHGLGSSPGPGPCLGSSPGPVSESSPKLSEDSAMVAEISRLSGLPRAVVIGLMEQGVELDVDCFQSDVERPRQGSSDHMRGATPGSFNRSSGPKDPSQYSSVHLHTDRNSNPQRPAQLSLSVPHSPQSQSGLTPPLSYSPQSHPSLTPPHSVSPQSHSSSPVHPYQATPARHSSLYQHHASSPSDPPSSTASSPASRGSRVRSPPRPLQPSPLGPTPLSVFRRDGPFQCSLPRVVATDPPLAGGIRPRGGSLRQGAGGGAWRRVEGEGLYQGKHASRELVRASTVSSFAKTESSAGAWGREDGPAPTPKRAARLWKGFEGRFWGREEDEAEEEEGVWRRDDEESRRRNYQKVKPVKREERQKENTWSRRKGGSEKRSPSLRQARRALFRSESQGVLEPLARREQPLGGRGHWASSLDVARGGMEFSVEGGGGRDLAVRKVQDKRLSSTASLFHLSRSQSLEGSRHSLSPPLSSPSFSPSPPPRAPLTRSRSLKDLGRRVFGSVRSLSLKHKTSKK